MHTFNITHTSESTGYERIVVGTYSAHNWRDALEQFYNDNHAGDPIKFAWLVWGMYVNGKQYIADKIDA